MAVPKVTSSYVSGLTLTVDADALAKVTDYLQVPADLVKTALTAFVNTTHQIGPAWTNGQIGSQIEGQYRPGVNDLVKLLGDLVQGFDSVGGTFTVAANNVVTTEDVNQT